MKVTITFTINTTDCIRVVLSICCVTLATYFALRAWFGKVFWCFPVIVVQL